MNKFRTTFLVLILFGFATNIFAQGNDSDINGMIKFINKAFEMNMTPGMAVGVVQDDKIVYTGGFGFADIEIGTMVTPETLFYIASTTKSFTAFASALLDDNGVIDLDKPFTDYLHGFEFNSSLKDSVITIRQLLTHTHSIDENFPIIFRTAFSGEFTDSLLLSLLQNGKASANGRKFDYGNLGYNIAGLVIDAKLNDGWKKVLDELIFTPLDMKNTHADINYDKYSLAMPHQATPDGFKKINYAKSSANMHAAGGHISNVNDLCNWLLVHINNGQLNDEQIFPADLVNDTHRLQATQDRNFGNVHRFGWGLGWDLGIYDNDTLVHRYGSFSGFRSHVSFMPRHKIGVVVLVNEGSMGSYFADMIAEYIYDYMLNKPNLDDKYSKVSSFFQSQAGKLRKRIADDTAKRAGRQKPLPFPLRDYTGVYKNPQLGEINITVLDGKLFFKAGMAECFAEVYDADNNQFRVELTGSGEVISFMFDDNSPAKFIYNGFEFIKSNQIRN